MRDYTNNNVYYYLDGTLTHTISFTANPITSMTQDLFIGYSGLYGYAGNTSASGVNIYYDDIRVFDRTLTTSEITLLASARGYTSGGGGGGEGENPSTDPVFHPFTSFHVIDA